MPNVRWLSLLSTACTTSWSQFRRTKKRRILLLTVALAVFSGFSAGAQDENSLQQLFNPLSDLSTAPLLFTHDSKIGPDELGTRSTVRLQPKSSFKLHGAGSITVLGDFPYIRQKDASAPGISENGFGDSTIQTWFAPPPNGAFSWGFGPVFSLPTGTNGMSSDRWAAGLTVLGVHSSPKWTFGANLDHFADLGGSGTGDLDETRLQAFTAYHPDDKWNLSIAATSDYYWEAGDFVAPVTLRVGRLTRIGDRQFNFGAGLGYWARPTAIGPRGVQLSFVIQPVFDRKRR